MVEKLEHRFRRCFPDYRPRWEVYEDTLRALLTPETVWIDVGCGANALVASMGRRCRLAVGIDLLPADKAPFVQAELQHLPLASSCADLVSLRLVVEHLEHIPADLLEIDRLLKPGGKLLVLTTNAASPLVLLPRLLPFKWKQWLLCKMFGVAEHEVFPTWHRFNTVRRMQRGAGTLEAVSLMLLEQTSFSQLAPAVIFGLWYALTRLPGLAAMRSNILAIFQKPLSLPSPS